MTVTYARQRIRKEVRHAPGDLRVLVACIAARLDKRTLVQDDQPVLVAGQRRAQELAGEQPQGVVSTTKVTPNSLPWVLWTVRQ